MQDPFAVMASLPDGMRKPLEDAITAAALQPGDLTAARELEALLAVAVPQLRQTGAPVEAVDQLTALLAHVTRPAQV